jgi:hypothetical protein
MHFDVKGTDYGGFEYIPFIKEDPAANYRESSTVRYWIIYICSLTPQQATGNALAVAVHRPVAFLKAASHKRVALLACTQSDC